MLTIDKFPAVTQEVDSMFNTSMKQKVNANFGMKLFGIRNVKHLDHKHLLMHGMGNLRPVGEGEEYQMSDSKEGDSVTWTQEAFQDGASITKKMRMFWRTENGKFMEQIKTISENAFDTIDQSMADVLSYGFDASYTNVYGKTTAALAPDGKTLFNTAHTTKVSDQTFNNIIYSGTTINPALSATALEQTVIAGFNDRRPVADSDTGNAAAINLDTVLVPPVLYPAAVKLIKSAKVAGSNNNDTNEFLMNLKIKMWDRLNVTGQGVEKSTQWYMYDSSRVKETLQALFAQKPQMEAPDKDFLTKNWRWTLDVYYTLGCGWPMYIRGSKGTNAA